MAEDEDIPRDAKMVKTILESMGVTRCEPRVINQFLDLWYRYVVEVLGDAQTYSEHAGKPAIDCDDVKLAIQSRVNSSFQQPPPREMLVDLAKARNSIPLPKIIGGYGISLPPEVDTLIYPNYQLILPTRPSFPDMDNDIEWDDDDDKDEAAKEPVQPTHLQDHGRKVSFSIAGKGLPKA